MEEMVRFRLDRERFYSVHEHTVFMNKDIISKYTKVKSHFGSLSYIHR